MQVAVEFQNERVELEVPEGRLIAAWNGPVGIAQADVAGLVTAILENPTDYPPLRLAVVPGDQVVIALGADVPEPAQVLSAVCSVLEAAGIEPGSITVVGDPDARESLVDSIPIGVGFRKHDPNDRPGLAYLATTSGERRVYLNKLLVDADFVLPIGRIGYDPVLDYRGPWGVIFPGMSDAESRKTARSRVGDAPPDPTRTNASLAESAEVSWLLGSQFQLGLIAGVTGVVSVAAGAGAAVLDRGRREVDAAWSFEPETRAELVIAGVGRADEPTGIGEVARGLATAMRLVQRGGKIVVLSRAEGPLGPAVTRLLGVDGPRAIASALKGHESDEDYPAARQLAAALAWADVYLLSKLGQDVVEDLSMVPLDRPEEARRLASVAASCVVVSHADLVRASVADEAEKS